MITDEDITKLAKVFITKEDLKTFKIELKTELKKELKEELKEELTIHFKKIFVTKEDLEKSLSEHTDYIVKEFVNLLNEGLNQKRRVDTIDYKLKMASQSLA